MSRRYWLPIIAVVGLALAGAVCAQPISDYSRTQQRPEQRQSKPETHATPLALDAIKNELQRISGALEAEVNKPKSAEEKEREQSDLSAQWEMARWAENMFWTALGSLVLTGFGVFLIWRTLVYTKSAAKAAVATVEEARKATVAATEATKEAKRQTDLAESSFRTVQRPYVFIFGVSGVVPGGENYAGIAPYTIGNFGQTPAIIENVQMFFGVGDKAPGILEDMFEDNPLAISPILESQEKRTKLYARAPTHLDDGVRVIFFEQTGAGSFEPVTPNIPEGREFYLQICIKYRGPFTDKHEVSACWRYDQFIPQFLKYGGEEYNYSR